MSFLRSGLVRALLILELAGLGLGGCSSKTTKPDETGAPSSEATPGGSHETFGPPEVFGPDAPPKKRELVLVLGPGLARGFAHLGILRELQTRKIPVGAIVGVEMGAWMSALHLASRTTNEADWAAQKIKEDIFLIEGLSIDRLFSRDKVSGKGLQELLDEQFQSRTVDSLNKKLFLCTIPEGQEGPNFFDSGSIVPTLRAAVADSSWIEIKKWRGFQGHSCGGKTPYPVEFARNLKIGPVVVVDLLPRRGDQTDKKTESYWEPLQRAVEQTDRETSTADLILQPEVSSISPFEFKKRSEAIYKGRTVVKEKLDQLRSLLGEDSENE